MAKKNVEAAAGVNLDNVEKIEDSRFLKFRNRAVEMRISDGKNHLVSNDDYVLGEEYGFTPPIVLSRPSFKERTAFGAAMERGDALSSMRIVFGADLNRFLDVLSDYEDETNIPGDDIAIGIMIDYFEHFYGKGVFEKSFRRPSI